MEDIKDHTVAMQAMKALLPFELLTGEPNHNDMVVTLRGCRVFVWFPAWWPKIMTFPMAENDVIVASFPKSGTTWLQHMVYLIQTENFEAAEKIPIVVRAPFMEMPHPPSPDFYDELAARPGPKLLKTHVTPPLLPLAAPNGKVIYVYRNAKDVAVSFYYHYIMWQPPHAPWTMTFEQFARKFLRGEVAFGPYPEHLKAYLEYQKAGKPILMLRYEDMKKDARAVIRRIAEFLGKPNMPNDVVERIYEATTIEAMRKNDATNYTKMLHGDNYEGPQFLRKGVVGDWKSHFEPHPELLSEFEEWIKTNVPEELRCNDQ